MSGAQQKLTVAVVGASSLIGEALIAELRIRKFPVAELHVLEDERNAGRRVANERAAADPGGEEDGAEDGELKTSDVTGFDFARADLVFFCGRAVLSERYAEAAAAHAWVIDNSPAFRLRPGVPLIAADVNGPALREMGPRGLVSLPGSASVALATALAPLRALAPLERVEVATYQAVSGSGRPGIDELAGETAHLLNGRQARGRVFGRQIAFNAIPQVDAIEEDGTSREERRLWQETRSLLGLPGLAVNATAVRVPVFFGHSLAVHAAFERPVDPLQALEVLRRGSGIEVIESSSTAQFPTPATLSTAPDRVYVGRMRADPTRDRALNFWVVADNVRKCAAHNAVSVAQILVNSAR
jgi:aspartate-semialdehyde dehydrogenase